MGAYKQVGALLAIACSRFSKFITCACWSDRAWSRILLLRIDSAESAPVIQRSLKFLLHTIFVWNLVHTCTLHRSYVTNLLLARTSMSRSSHVTVWHSLSTFHFVNVAYATFLFFASGADASPELDALFILTVVLVARLETSHLNYIC